VGWVTGKAAEHLKSMSHLIPGSPGAWGVRLEGDDERKVELMTGFFARVVSDPTPPRDLLKMMKEMVRHGRR
jgi:hypothetical protein